jgi:ubiquitin thioesterase otulin
MNPDENMESNERERRLQQERVQFTSQLPQMKDHSSPLPKRSPECSQYRDGGESEGKIHDKAHMHSQHWPPSQTIYATHAQKKTMSSPCEVQKADDSPLLDPKKNYFWESEENYQRIHGEACIHTPQATSSHASVASGNKIGPESTTSCHGRQHSSSLGSMHQSVETSWYSNDQETTSYHMSQTDNSSGPRATNDFCEPLTHTNATQLSQLELQHRSEENKQNSGLPVHSNYYDDPTKLRSAERTDEKKIHRHDIRKPPTESVPELNLGMFYGRSFPMSSPTSSAKPPTESVPQPNLGIFDRRSFPMSPPRSSAKSDDSHALTATQAPWKSNSTMQKSYQKQSSYPGDLMQNTSNVHQHSMPEGGQVKENKQKIKVQAHEPDNVSEPFAIMTYAAKEWKGNTEKAVKMLKGYQAIPANSKKTHLRRIRGDNYCAIRASLFQALATRLPILEELSSNELKEVPRKLLGQGCHWLFGWSFANRVSGSQGDEVIRDLEDCLSILSKRALHAKECSDDCVEYVLHEFNGENRRIDFALMEATKLLMLRQAVQLYEKMQQGEDVPVWVFILFARDTSPDPQRLMTNHLNNVGDTGGLEQVEMFLLGYTFQATLKVFRPSQFDAEDFVSRYPDDLGENSPVLELVAEDDRHYNIIVTDTFPNQGGCV